MALDGNNKWELLRLFGRHGADAVNHMRNREGRNTEEVRGAGLASSRVISRHLLVFASCFRRLASALRAVLSDPAGNDSPVLA